MKRIYCLIDSGDALDQSTRFLQVRIGQSQQDDRDFLYLVAYAASHGHYFERRTQEVAEFFRRCMESVYGTPVHPLNGHPYQVVNARDLVRELRAREKSITINQLKQRMPNRLDCLSD